MKDNLEQLRLCITSALAKTGEHNVNKKIKHQLVIYKNYVGTYYYTNLSNKLFLYLASPRERKPPRKNKPSIYSEWNKDISTLQNYINWRILGYLQNSNEHMRLNKERLNQSKQDNRITIDEACERYYTPPTDIITKQIGTADITDFDFYNPKSPETITIIKQTYTDANEIELTFLDVITKKITATKAIELLKISRRTFYKRFNDYKNKVNK